MRRTLNQSGNASRSFYAPACVLAMPQRVLAQACQLRQQGSRYLGAGCPPAISSHCPHFCRCCAILIVGLFYACNHTMPRAQAKGRAAAQAGSREQLLLLSKAKGGARQGAQRSRQGMCMQVRPPSSRRSREDVLPCTAPRRSAATVLPRCSSPCHPHMGCICCRPQCRAKGQCSPGEAHPVVG